MLFQTVFREKALARRSQREAVDARLQVTAPHEWLFVSGLAVALVVLLAFLLLGRAERGLSLDTVLVRPGERIDVVAGASGVVVEVLSEVGDTVTRGQSIARVRTPEAERLDDVLAPQAGELVTLNLAIGQRTGAGELAARVRVASEGPDSGGRAEVFGFVTSEEAARLAPHMAAQVRVAVPGAGPARILSARVEEVSPRAAPPVPWLVDFGLEAPPRAHLLRATLTDEQTAPVIDGAAGTLRVVLGHRSFASLVFGNDGD